MSRSGGGGGSVVVDISVDKFKDGGLYDWLKLIGL